MYTTSSLGVLLRYGDFALLEHLPTCQMACS